MASPMTKPVGLLSTLQPLNCVLKPSELVPLSETLVPVSCTFSVFISSERFQSTVCGYAEVFHKDFLLIGTDLKLNSYKGSAIYSDE